MICGLFVIVNGRNSYAQQIHLNKRRRSYASLLLWKRSHRWIQEGFTNGLSTNLWRIGLSIYNWQNGFPNNGFSTNICHRDWRRSGVQAPRKKSMIVICKTFAIFSDSARLNTATALWYSLQQSTSGLSDLYRLHFATELIDGTLIINMLLIQKLLLEVMMCLFHCKHVFSNKVQGPDLHSLQSFKLLKQEW